jgi:hypothetical protein
VAKAFILVLASPGLKHSAVIDLDRLPAGTHSQLVLETAAHLDAIGNGLLRDVKRAASMLDRFNAGRFDDDVLDLLTQLASLIENAPPLPITPDLLILVMRTRFLSFLLEPGEAEMRWEMMLDTRSASRPAPFLEI